MNKPLTTHTGVSLSPRLSHGHTEPSYDSSVKCQVSSSSTANSTFSVEANCNSLPSDLLDVGSKNQQFIYAAGPPNEEISLKSDSATASLKRHDWYGHFSMDMTQATATNGKQAGVPPISDTQTESGATQEGDPDIDHYFGSGAHAVVMCFAFVILFPGGVLVLRLLNSVKWHGAVQAVAAIFTLVGVGTGIAISKQYNKVSFQHQAPLQLWPS